jgi:hypothetical protein
VDVELFAAVVDGHVSAEPIVFCVCKELVHEGGEGEAALEVDA